MKKRGQHQLDIADVRESAGGRASARHGSIPGPVAVVRDIVLGLGAMAAGVLGLVLPILPGWILIFVGAFILAGRIPLLRRGLSRLLASAPAQSVVRRISDAPPSRRLLTRMLARPTIRQALETPVRWRLLRRMLQSEAHGSIESSIESDERRAHAEGR